MWRSCLSKVRYSTYKRAIKRALYYTKKFNKAQYVYWCPYCRGFHITGVPQENERERKLQEIAINKVLRKGQKKANVKTEEATEEPTEEPTEDTED